MWERELQGDPDESFLLDGVSHGFQLVSDFEFKNVEVENYKSALDPLNRDLVEEQIRTELLEGRYEIVQEKPAIVSALGAIRKPNGKIRLIHDASRPIGGALNEYADELEAGSFQSVSDAVGLLSHNAYMSKIDLKSAYRSVGVHPSSFPGTGLKWKFKGDTDYSYIIDKCLPFGAKFSPGIFHRLTQAVRRMMLRRGYRIVVYLDDFLIVEKDLERCLMAQRCLLALLRELGFSIAWEKVEGPSQTITFLGVVIDSVNDLLLLPQQKLCEFEELVKELLGKKRISLKKLQSLAGKLNWASSVVRGGRTYLRRILDMMKPLKHSRHKLIISREMRLDLEWWSSYLRVCNGRKVIKYASTVHFVYVDACDDGGACFYNGDWQYINWKVDYPEMCYAHINIKEAFMVVMAVRRWGIFWSDHEVVVRSDNRTTCSAFTKYTSKSKPLMHLIREVFLWSLVLNFELRCWYLPGDCNFLADALSRLNEWDKVCSVAFWLEWETMRFCWPFVMVLHMSYNAFLYIVPQILRWFSSDVNGHQ